MDFFAKPRRAVAPALLVRRKLRKHNNGSENEGSRSAANEKRTRSSGGLSTLHPEEACLIFAQLPVSVVGLIARTCREYRLLCCTAPIRRPLFARNFPHPTIHRGEALPSGHTWKSRFRAELAVVVRRRLRVLDEEAQLLQQHLEDVEKIVRQERTRAERLQGCPGGGSAEAAAREEKARFQSAAALLQLRAIETRAERLRRHFHLLSVSSKTVGGPRRG
ncbi:hypothetical protein T484DRAFT_1957793 [Baffinella frigidus]|nr:hypothetical protein T484DRAFT_1957793 [Cryptophyta sp. CCMP2293]